MTAFSLIGFACIVSGWAIAKKNTVIAIVASAIWLATIAYTRSNPIGTMVTGDTSDTAILVALIGLMVLVPIISFRLSKKEEATQLKDEGLLKDDGNDRMRELQNTSSTRTQKESGDDYYGRLHRLTHPRR